MNPLEPSEDPIELGDDGERNGSGPRVASNRIAVEETRPYRPLADGRPGVHGPGVHGTRPARWPLLAAVVVALAVLVAGSLSWLGRPGNRVRTVPVTVAVSAAAQRALDCPDGVECFLGPAQPATVTLVRQDFPGARLRDGWRTILGSTGETVRETVRADAPGELAITLQARCVPGGSPIPASTSRSTEPGGRQQLIVVVPGQAGGCSVAVVVEGPTGAGLPEAAATALAHSSSLQLG